MKTDYLSHDELQHIEHCNRVIEHHLELVGTTRELSKEAFVEILKSMTEFVSEMKRIQTDLGSTIQNIYRSARELKQATGGTQELMAYIAAVDKLNNTLDDKLIEKLQRIINK